MQVTGTPIEEQEFKEQPLKSEMAKPVGMLCPFMGKTCKDGYVDGHQEVCRMWIRLEKVMMSNFGVPTKETFYVCALADKTPTMVPVMQQR